MPTVPCFYFFKNEGKWHWELHALGTTRNHRALPIGRVLLGIGRTGFDAEDASIRGRTRQIRRSAV